MNHAQIDERSLAFGRLIADRLRDDPSLIDRAVQNIDRWLTTASPQAAALLEWKQTLAGPIDEVIKLLTHTDERSTRLRQSNPFAGVLTPDERSAIIRQFQRT